MKVVVATHNPGKLRELEAILAPELELVSQAALGIAEAEEPHATFVENALAKARHASRAARLPALADDSGLCLPALGGEPGVHSAYYAGRDGGRDERDARNNRKLLAALGDERSAYYCCLMVLVRRPKTIRSWGEPGEDEEEITKKAPVSPKTELTWIEIQLVDEQDRPVPSEQYSIELPDGSVRNGSLDAEGLARLDGLQPGTCKVTFPRLDGREWRPA